ncbi:MAG: hypothetical protein WED33_10245 [Bacteroidia bacterium]
MAKADNLNKEKSKLLKAFLKFELKGLKSYYKYIEKEFNNAEGAKNKKKYANYLKKEKKRASERMNKIEGKLK